MSLQQPFNRIAFGFVSMAGLCDKRAAVDRPLGQRISKDRLDATRAGHKLGF
jgi:hypothetical protein